MADYGSKGNLHNVNITRKEDRLERMFDTGHFALSNSCTHFVTTLALEDLSHVCFTSFYDYGVMNGGWF